MVVAGGDGAGRHAGVPAIAANHTRVPAVSVSYLEMVVLTIAPTSLNVKISTHLHIMYGSWLILIHSHELYLYDLAPGCGYPVHTPPVLGVVGWVVGGPDDTAGTAVLASAR